MALRIRSDGRVLCAAIHPPKSGDAYLDDAAHQRLSVDLKVLVTQPYDHHCHRGEWWWRDAVPDGIEVDSFYLE